MKKRIVSLLVIPLLLVFLLPITIEAKNQYRVKEKYIGELGKKFCAMKEKYGWELSEGEYIRAGWFEYRFPKKQLVFYFDSDYNLNMTENSKCSHIISTTKRLINGMKKNSKKFIKRLYSKGTKPKWRISGQVGSEVWIHLYGKNKKKYTLVIFLSKSYDRKKDTLNEVITKKTGMEIVSSFV